MKKQRIHFTVLLVIQTLLLCFLASLVWAEDLPTLEKIEFNKSSTDEEQITFKLNGTYIPKIFAIKGKKPRVVFDFPKTKTASTLNNLIKTNGQFIKQIRIGIHKGKDPKTRVVLDLLPNKDIDFNQNFDKQKNALTVSVYYATSKPEASAKEIADKKTGTEPETANKEQQVAPEATPPTKKNDKSPVTTSPLPVSTPTEQVAPAAPPSPKKAVQKSSQEKQPGKSDPPILRFVKFDNTSNRGEMIQFKLNDFYPPIVFGIEEGLPRVVCDFKDTLADKTLGGTIAANGRYVKAIRVGKHSKPNKIRVVIDLEPNNSYDLQQVFFKEDNLFVIIVNTMHHTPPVQELEKPLTQPQ